MVPSTPVTSEVLASMYFKIKGELLITLLKLQMRVLGEPLAHFQLYCSEIYAESFCSSDNTDRLYL